MNHLPVRHALIYAVLLTSGCDDAIGTDADDEHTDPATDTDHATSDDHDTDTDTDTDMSTLSVLSTSPADGATHVSITRVIHVFFSTPPDPETVDVDTFGVMDGATSIDGVVTILGATATFTPSVHLTEGHTYQAIVSDDVRDQAGRALDAEEAWTFTAGAEIGGTGGVDLQSASDFAVLAGATVTSTGQTVVTGDLGISAGTALTGFPPGVLHGVNHSGDTAAAQAKLDLTAAFNDAAARSVAPITIAGNLGGRTLAPGLYKSETSLEISSGDLTLDAAEDGNAVWIFQMGSSFTVTSGRQVLLTNGAKAANVYWQIGSSATLGSSSAMVGNLLADQSISMATGATLEGRVLTRIAAVTLQSNVIKVPSP